MNNNTISIEKRIFYLLALVTFTGIMAIENPQLFRVSRTAVVIPVVYIITYMGCIHIFGGFDVGKRKYRDIVNSLLLSQMMTDLVSYLILMFMNTNINNGNLFLFSSKKLLVLVIATHILEIVVFTRLANHTCFRIHSGEKCVVIADENQELKNVQRAMAEKNIVITEVMSCSENWQEKLREAENVVIYNLPLGTRKQIMEYAYKYDKNIYFNPDICDILEVSAEHQMFEDSLMLYSPKFELTDGQLFAKRMLDITVSLLMIIISSPIWLACMLAIKLDDGGKIFFTQDRATKGGRAFKICKFRTMVPSDRTRPANIDDDRITRAGRIIRKTRMDELPQLLNILKGDMSLVGPRPEQMKYIHGFDKNYEEYEYRLKVKAGLTGYAQIEGKYNTTNKDKLILDLMYIQNYSIWLDIKLLMQTVLVFFKKDSSEGF